LIGTFGSLAGVLAAEPHAIVTIANHPASAAHVRLLGSAYLHSLRAELEARPLLAAHDSVVDYLSASQAHAQHEILRVLFLNSGHYLLSDEYISIGSVHELRVDPRAILKRALDLGATGMILAHNHPSGDCTPSRADIDATRSLVAAGRFLDVGVYDHLILARDGCTSLRAQGLL
jgi:DNA repair protein RadC